MKRGFTVVEILVTLVVIAILLGLGTVGLRATLVNGRDSERKADAETIARGLEQFYTYGVAGYSKGHYPSLNEFWNDVVTGSKSYTDLTPGTSMAAFTSPSDNKGLILLCIFQSPSAYWTTQPGCEAPGNASKIRSSISSDWYGYEPLTPSGAHCYNASDCVAFNLYWFSEAENDIKKISSRHQ